MAKDAYLSGELREWPDKQRMVSILRAAGLRFTVGRYSIRFDDLTDFIFQEYGGDLGKPRIEANGNTPDLLQQEASRVSAALAAARIAHRFEIYSDRGEMLHYLHYDWPLDLKD